MIRYTAQVVVGKTEEGNKTTYYTYVEGFCNNDDTKPVEGIANGSNLIESDTGDWYFFNEKTKAWSKMRTIKE